MEVIVACSSRQEMDFVETIGTLYPGHHCTFKMLKVPWYYRIIDPVISMWTFRRKQVILRHNLHFFRELDALVSPEVKCADLRKERGLKNLIMIRTFHGAGDRDGVLDDRLLAFDFMLLPGQKYVTGSTIRDYTEGLLRCARLSKFEVVLGLKRKIRRLFDNDNPIVVYNPHFDWSQSSRAPMALQVLEFFNHREFNLIFAPHVVLLKGAYAMAHSCRKIPTGAEYPCRHGSDASRYDLLLAADIYLGDVSSQVYEFCWNLACSSSTAIMSPGRAIHPIIIGEWGR
jgi:hypothetical protein